MPLWLVVPALALGIWLTSWVASTAPDFENLALGEMTMPIYGSYQGDKIFCSSLADVSQCLDPARKRHLAKRVVWFGNSQLHAINQAKLGDKTAPTLLAEQLRPLGVEVQGFSFPSSSLAELLVAWEYFRRDAHVDVLVVPLFFDDMREQGTREMLRAATDQPEIAASLNATQVGREIVKRLPRQEVNENLDRSRASLQIRSEDRLTALLERCCKMQTERAKARGQIEVQAFYFRNWLFGITAQTARPMIPEAYNHNWAAIIEILKQAKAEKTRVILYIPPLRQDFSPPYDLVAYAKYKVDTAKLAKIYGAQWIDVDAIVPGKYWGTKAATRIGGDPELDFMHYQGAGHRLLESHIAPLVERALK